MFVFSMMQIFIHSITKTKKIQIHIQDKWRSTKHFGRAQYILALKTLQGAYKASQKFDLNYLKN